jgi:hypothetical protein
VGESLGECICLVGCKHPGDVTVGTDEHDLIPERAIRRHLDWA